MRALIFLTLLVFNSANSYAFEKNSIAVIISNEVVTTFDVRREIFYDRVVGGSDWNRGITEGDIRDFIPTLIEKWLVAQEAVKFSVTEITPDDISMEVGNFKNRFKSSQEFENFMNISQLAPADLERLLARDVQAREFLKIKLPTLEPQPTNEEIESYYWQHAVKYKGKKPSDVRDEIVAELRVSLKDRAYRRWMLDLRTRANLVYVIR
ncbi:MAG: hypothetical protein A3F16_07935 [Deltaproteobacteria bacterium RIFCSPHIGHO2_12_FULL_43_9]|nr:MAG: hypothetical protein A3F16_07935 [Deltaproteobacteria bacterium RIFCSPHIGHO2_12_FULL_43_9]